MLEFRMMPAEPLMDQARRAMREERIEDAQAILINVIALEPENEEAWVLRAEAITDASKKRQCLERAQTINPRNRAIARALESLDAIAPPETPPAPAPVPASAVEPPAPPPPPANPPTPAPSRVAEIIATPIHFTPLQRTETIGGPVEPLLEAGEALAVRVVQCTDPLETRELGCDLLRLLDEAAASDLAETRRWARANGRDALLRFEQVLTAVIANLPRDNPQLAQLREQRHRALSYLR